MLRTLPLLALALLTLPAHAETPLRGSFTATTACPAVQSISRKTNPGRITLTPGQSYDLLAANKTPPTHLRIEVPGASPSQRWVAIACGTTDADLGNAQPSQPVAQSARGQDFVLAVNWQPAFCELNTRVRECRDQRPNSFEATNFTLHGLWPQDGEYCGVSNRDRYASQDGRWRDLPPLDLTIAQRQELDKVMPGSVSGLDRHEWSRHGSCYDGSQRQYIAAALDLMRALNASEVSALFAGNIGKRLSASDVQSAFEASFGRGTGARVSLDCEADGNRTLIVELRIALSGDIATEDLPTLLRNAAPTTGGCRSGQVDAVGLK